MTKLQQMIQQLQQEVYFHDYYVALYVLSLQKHEMLATGVLLGQYSDAKIVDMANDFWLDLPDVPEIRREPFWLLCDIAEYCFGGDEDE